ncbi:MAG: 1-deoxy-D-xylulose-5-phosphate reductoisomerase [Burkholderiaceae bacterium]|nr:1-deoxy-D-xylulose-5-phosphate reductoisomerase [Burkholderiaceae bacterium]
MQRISILGATGSIGDSTLSLIEQHPERFSVFALSAANRMEKLARLCIKFRPQVVAVPDDEKRQQLLQQLPSGIAPHILTGAEGLVQIAVLNEVDSVVSAIVGAAGLLPTLAAARGGKRLLLANKEALVVGGPLLTREAMKQGALLLPLDSEHNALFQCMPGQACGKLSEHGIKTLWLTASGGPFLNRELSTLSAVTPEQACAHPNWVMGRKISVDSATMMNKGLEIIEARWLFDCPVDNIQVVIHPQSVIHSMVEYIDGSFLAQLGNPDMRTPIAHALAYPDRISSGVKTLDPLTLSSLSFRAPDMSRFACLALARQALARGHAACIVLNAANEIAVEAFLESRILFTDIEPVVQETLQKVNLKDPESLEEVLYLDALARKNAITWIANAKAVCR